MKNRKQLKFVIFYRPMLQKNIRYSYSFLDKFGIQSKVPNSSDVILKSRDSQQLILMKQIQVQAEQYQQTLATLEYQKKLSHEQLLALVDYYPQPAIHKFVVLYEYCSISLMDQFENRLGQRRIFSEPELWSIFTSLVFGLAYLQEQNVGHGSISLSDCFLNDQGFIKISDPTCATSNPYSILRGYFYAPEILRCLIHDTGEEINIFKSDAFSLGLCMLQLSLMRDVSQIFDYEQGKINNIGLKCLISDFTSIGLSRQYINFVVSLLTINPWERPDFIQLKSQIFNFLALDTIEQSEQILRNSYGIKSSISSLCRSKQDPSPMFKQPRQQLENRKIKETKSAVLNAQFQAIFNNQPESSSKKSRSPLRQLHRDSNNNQLLLNELTILSDKPNVDYLFGNMKKSIHLGDCQKMQNIENEYFPRQMRRAKQDRVKDKAVEEIAHLQDNIEKIQFNLQRKRRQREESSKSKFQTHNYFLNEGGFIQDQNAEEHALEESKVQVIQKQLQKLFQSPLLPKKNNDTSNKNKNTNDTKKSYLNNSAASKISQFTKQNPHKSQLLLQKPQSRHKKSQSNHPRQPRKSEMPTYKPKQYNYQLEQSYTDPFFLQMMKADVQQILSKRKIHFQ